jgi:hypothetical protein
LSQALHEELKAEGVKVQALCPGIVGPSSTSGAVPRVSADDVVTASLRSLELGEVVCAPGVERSDLRDAMFEAALSAFSAQSPHLAERYRDA